MNDYNQGFIDGLELVLYFCDQSASVLEVKERVCYYVQLAREEKFEKLREQLGAFR